MMLVVYLVIAGTDIGLTSGALRGFVTLGVLIMGLGTLLNGLTTRVSAGHLLVVIPGTMTMMVFIPVAKTLGLGAAAGGVFIAGIVVFFLGRFLPRLRALFPPEVTGVLLLLLGMSLLPGGVRRCAGLSEGGGAPVQMDHVLIAIAALGTITSVAVWGSARFRVLSLGMGAAAGLLAAALTGHFGARQLAAVAGQPLFSLPVGDYPFPMLAWVPGAIIPLVFCSVIGAVDELGCGVVIDRMNNDEWRRPDMPMLGRLLSGNGICLCLSGLAGTLTTGCSSAHLGLAHATGVAARRVAAATGLLLILAAFLPRLATFIIMLPAAVVGAIMVYAAAYMMVSGAELVLARLLNGRRRATVGLGLAAGMAVMLVPELTASVPLDLKPLFGSGILVGVSMAMALNLVFRIGMSRSGELELGGKNPAEQAARFLEDCGSAWGARRDVITRAGLVAGEALEALAVAGLMKGAARLSASFDENRLLLTLDYPGRAWQPAEVRPVVLDAWLDKGGGFELNETMRTVSSNLICSLADRVESGEQDGRGRLRLIFDH